MVLPTVASPLPGLVFDGALVSQDSRPGLLSCVPPGVKSRRKTRTCSMSRAYAESATGQGTAHRAVARVPDDTQPVKPALTMRWSRLRLSIASRRGGQGEVQRLSLHYPLLYPIPRGVARFEAHFTPSIPLRESRKHLAGAPGSGPSIRNRAMVATEGRNILWISSLRSESGRRSVIPSSTWGYGRESTARRRSPASPRSRQDRPPSVSAAWPGFP